MSIEVSGTEGYAQAAQFLVGEWRSISFARSHEPVLHRMPGRPARVVDIGAGIGTAAAALAGLGHTVVAVEPVDAFREAGMRRYPAARIEWVDDSLPDLSMLHVQKGKFDLAMLSAVWMHLDAPQRRRAMGRMGDLIVEGGQLILSLRHGPVPAGRRMFDVSAEETIELARGRGLHVALNVRSASIQQRNQRAGVTWTWLAFVKASESPAETGQLA